VVICVVFVAICNQEEKCRGKSFHVLVHYKMAGTHGLSLYAPAGRAVLWVVTPRHSLRHPSPACKLRMQNSHERIRNNTHRIL